MEILQSCSKLSKWTSFSNSIKRLCVNNWLIYRIQTKFCWLKMLFDVFLMCQEIEPPYPNKIFEIKDVPSETGKPIQLVYHLRHTINHYCGVIMGAMVSQITILTIVYSIVYSDAYQRKHQSSASLAFVQGIHRSQMASNAENVSIWWRHHGVTSFLH